MDRKAIIAIAISAVFLFFYPYFLKKIYPPAPKAQGTQVMQPEGTSAPHADASAFQAAGSAPAGKTPAKMLAKETLTTIETPLYKAVLTNVGGAVKGWELKKYRVSRAQDALPLNLAKTPTGETTFKTELTADSTPETVLFSTPATEITLSGDETKAVVFTGTSPQGLRIEKRFLFDARSYMVNTELRIKNMGQGPFEGLVTTSMAAAFNTGPKKKKKAYFHTGPIVKSEQSLLRQKKKNPTSSGSGKLLWLGIEDKYFLTAIIPVTDIPVSWDSEIYETGFSRLHSRFAVKLAPGQTAAYSYKSFMGPKTYSLLVQEKHDLQKAIEFGFFSFMAKPILVVLLFFQRFVGNYGIAIIILTVIIKIIFYPLTKHSLSSMAGMKRVQPQLTAIKERYKDDKARMNKEIMELYKKYKINPLSGCLPMVLQIPVFIALYEVLYVSIELRHAPFFLWITDLSARDAYYITPVLMGVSMFFQQRMTPSSPDPTQAKMMMFMPVIFTVMFLNFPSGLVIYWLVNNILAIAQQYFINRQQKPSTPAAPAPPAPAKA